MSISSMSNEFHDWLEQCPVQWVRNSDNGKGTTEYTFIEESEKCASCGCDVTEDHSLDENGLCDDCAEA